jgi:hypothetical protein
MNRLLVYAVIAILLGTVTMVSPLAVLESKILIPDSQSTITDWEPNTQESDRGYLSPEEPAVPSSPDSYDRLPPEPQESNSKLILTDATSTLSSIGLMIVPSFIVALSVFIYFKKRIR